MLSRTVVHDIEFIQQNIISLIELFSLYLYD